MADSNEYMLGRAKIETSRLNIQHNILGKISGYDLHPDILERLGPNARIADVATGTAAWLDDVSKQVAPTCEFHGFDISANQFPPPEQLPPNIKLHLQDMKKPFPIEWHGTFDVVHIRFVIVVMGDDDWELVFKNVYPLLKPKGAIQWSEIDSSQMLPALRGATHVKPINLNEMAHQWYNLVGFPNMKKVGVQAIPKIFAENGMNVYDDAVGSDVDKEGSEGIQMTFMTMLVTSMNLAYDRKYENAWPPDKIMEMRDKAMQEINAGCYVRSNIHNVIGFKSS